jgi:uncharacterized repeat protein (TIGR02543 family)
MEDTLISSDTGNTLSFSVSANGSSPLIYLWQKDSTILSEKADKKFNLSKFTINDVGAYRCIASNCFGIDTSRIINLKFHPIKGGIKGFLISNKNSSRLNGVVVTMMPGNMTSKSNSEGLFEFQHLFSGIYSIAITLNGYQDFTKTSIDVNDSAIKDIGLIVLMVNDSGNGNHKVTYNGNDNTAGSVILDTNSYKSGTTITIQGNTGALVKTGCIFNGWTTKADGGGKIYSPGDTLLIGASNITLFAIWKTQSSLTLTLTYNGNGKTGGTAPVDSNKYAPGESVSVLGNSGGLVKTGYSFAGWNTKTDGAGTNFNVGSQIAMPSFSDTLFAKWTTKQTYSVIYNKNGADSGNVPAEGQYESGATVTISGNIGNLLKTGYTFSGWNTLANGTGTSYAPIATFIKSSINDTLFAKWTVVKDTIKFDPQGGSSVALQSVNY